jgi:protein-L-isoaspartate(D-aspartate) O-methyltransferase
VTTVATELWDGHYATVSPNRPNGNPWRTVNAAELDALDAHVTPPAPGARALDVGCGTGQLTDGLHHLGYDAIGIDAAPTAIHRARTTYAGPTFMLGDIAAAAMSPGAYALITTRLVYPFLPDPTGFLARAAQLLAPGGQLLVVDYLDTDPPAKARGIGLDTTHQHQLAAWSAHIDRYTCEGLRGLVCTPKETS